MSVFHANLVAVLTAAVLQWVVGWLWFGVIFNKAYKSLLGVSESEKPSNAGGVMALIFIANFILSFALAQVLMLTGHTSATNGAFVGVVCGLGFVVPPLLAQHLSERKPFKLFGINALYWLLAMLLSGALLAIWH